MAARSALVGRYAEAAIDPADGASPALIVLLFDWSVEVNQKVVELTAHGDYWEYQVPTVAGWTFRAKGYVVPASASHYINNIWASGALPGGSGYVFIKGFSGSVASGTPIFAGHGVPLKGVLSVPMEMATQEFEIRGHGAPTIGV